MATALSDPEGVLPGEAQRPAVRCRGCGWSILRGESCCFLEGELWCAECADELLRSRRMVLE